MGLISEFIFVLFYFIFYNVIKVYFIMSNGGSNWLNQGWVV